MPLFEAVRLALSQIRAQKLKSFFTLLGVMIGVTFLIAVVSIVEGMGDYMEKDLVGKLMGVNTFELRHRPYINIGDVDEAEWRSYRTRPRLEIGDVEPVVAALPAGTRYYVSSQDRVQVESHYSRPRVVDVFAVTGDYFDIKNMGITSGRALGPVDFATAALNVVIGKDVAEAFFPGVSPLGRQLKIGGLPYTVVGIAEPQGSSFGHSFDRFVVAPY